MIEIVVENYWLEVFGLIMLTVLLLFFINQSSTKKVAFANITKPEIHSNSKLLHIVFKTIIFTIIVWLLSYLFNVLALINTSTPQFITPWIEESKADGSNIDTAKIVSIWVLFLLSSAFHFSLTTILSNLFTSFIFASMYIGFNIQLSFAAITLVFFSYLSILGETNFVIYFIILLLAMWTGFIFFKIKKKLLNAVRGYYLYRPTANKITKVTEFYIVCMPYIIYSTLFSITILSSEFNLLMQLVISHLFAYFIIYKFYKQGHDIGFDYDPF